jgi:hypothetical protein
MNTSQQHKTFLLKEIGNLALVNYEPAVLCGWDSGCVIEYRVLNPFTGELERKPKKKKQRIVLT